MNTANETHALVELDLGTKVATIRRSRGWSQTELASRAGCCRATIGRFEASKADPGFSTVEAIAQALGFTVPGLLALDTANVQELDTATLAADLRELAARAGKLVIH